MPYPKQLTKGDIENYELQLKREADLRAQGIEVPSTVPLEVRVHIEAEARGEPFTDQGLLIKGQWPGPYPTRVEELPDSITELPDWEVEDINRLEPKIRNHLFGSWQTNLVPATIKISKILQRERQEKERHRQAQIEQARQAGYTVMSEPQSKSTSFPINQYMLQSQDASESEALGDSGRHWSEAEIERVAHEVLNHINPTSIEENLEYGGTIERIVTRVAQGDGTFKESIRYEATIPNVGTAKYVDIAVYPASTVAAYHTHGSYSKTGPNGEKVKVQSKDEDEYDSDNFSGWSNSDNAFENDMAVALRRMRMTAEARSIYGETYKSFLGTPSGEIKVYVP